MARVRSICGNSEKGPSVSTRAMLTRQSKASSVAPSGCETIWVVDPPPFFQGWAICSAALMTRIMAD